MQRLDICSELRKAGFRRGSRAWKRAYRRKYYELNRERFARYKKRSLSKRKARRASDPSWREEQNAKWRAWCARKKKANPSWNSKRLAEWRKKNPEKWKALMKRASTHGLHRRFYERHRERVLKQKRAAKVERDPTYGLKWLIYDVKAGRKPVAELIEQYRTALTRLDGVDERSRRPEEKREAHARRLPVRR